MNMMTEHDDDDNDDGVDEIYPLSLTCVQNTNIYMYLTLELST